MGEPFSTASSAVGVISLGLQVCGQLVKYCQAYKGFEGDVQRLGKRANSLRRPLKQLRDLIEDFQLSDPETAADLKEKAMQLEESVGKLQAKFDSCKPVLDASDFSGKVRLQIKKATHVFGNDIIDGMEDDLNAIQQTINTVVNINTYRKVLMLEVMNQSIVKQEARQEIMLKLMEEMHHVSMNRISTRNLPPPALLQSLCCHQAEQAHLICAAEKMESQIETEIQATDMSWPADHSWAMAFRRTQEKNRAKHRQRSFQYFSRLLNRVFYASFSVSTGAGGFSLAPMLKIQAVYTDGSWQYKMIDKLHSLRQNLITSSLALDISEYTIHEFRVAFSEGKASPSDMIYSGTSRSISLIDLLSVLYSLWGRSTPGIYRVVRFLGECGSIPNNCSRFGILGTMCATFLWTEEDWPTVSYLLDLGGPLKGDLPRNMIAKRNMQYIMSRDEDGVSCPSIISIILRESVEELRSVLEVKSIRPRDKVEGVSASALLDLTIGWPQGIKVLLEFGADPSQVTWSLIDWFKVDADTGIFTDTIVVSVKILLSAGAIVGTELLSRSGNTGWNSLVIQSVAKRRQKLWECAQIYLLPEQIARFNKSEDTIIDAQVAELHELLKDLGKPIPSLQESLRWRPGQSVYHGYFDSTDVLDELYAYGFRDIDSVDSDGLTPSMTDSYPEKAAWLASKGANWNRKMPHSNATVAHLWSAQITGHLLNTFLEWENFRTQKLREWEKTLSDHNRGSSVFLLPAKQDECVCPCSPGGCTTLSVSLRHFRWNSVSLSNLGQMPQFPIEISSHFKGPEFRKVSIRSHFQRILGILIDYSKRIPQAERIFIRTMTFEGLGLKHACCIEIDSLFTSAQRMKGRSEHEVNEILDEEKNRYEELEDLVLEFETAFTELGLPMWEFLTRHWQPRMIKHLSHRDPYDKEHHEGTRKIGVNLEVDDSDIPGWIHLLGDQIEEVDDEDS